MLKVHIWYHKDGDSLAIVSAPWWTGPIEYIAGRLLNLWYRPANAIICWCWKKEKHLYQISIESGCDAQHAIYPNYSSCWVEDCSHGKTMNSKPTHRARVAELGDQITTEHVEILDRLAEEDTML